MPLTRTQLSVTSVSTRTSPLAESAGIVTFSGVAIAVEISHESSSILEAKNGRGTTEGTGVKVSSCCGSRVSMRAGSGDSWLGSGSEHSPSAHYSTTLTLDVAPSSLTVRVLAQPIVGHAEIEQPDTNALTTSAAMRAISQFAPLIDRVKAMSSPFIACDLRISEPFSPRLG